jgi:hypothetical protein
MQETGNNLMYELIADPLYELYRTNEYKLSIEVSLDGFSFSVTHPGENKLIALGNFPVTVSSEIFLGRRFNEWYDNQDILKHSYNEIRLLYNSDKFTIIPSEYYMYEKQNEAGNFIFEKKDSYSWRDNYLPYAESNLIFRIPDSFIKVSEQKFPNNKIVHPLTLLIKKTEELSDGDNPLAALLFRKESFSTILYLNGRLQFINNFGYAHANDVVYYLTSLSNKLNISYNNLQILIAGDIASDSEIDYTLKKYFPGTAFLTPGINYNKNIFNVPMHRFLTLC